MNLSKLDAILDKKLGSDWHTWEIETVSLEIGAKLDDLTVIKLVILKSLQEHPDIILNDADYFLRFVEVANGNVPDPHHADIPTSLEIDFALREMEAILGDKAEKTPVIKNIIKYVVKEEGHGQICSPILSKYSDVSILKTEKTEVYEQYASEMGGK